MKPRQTKAKTRYDKLKSENKCVKCGHLNDNLPMVACKTCYNKVLKRRGETRIMSHRAEVFPEDAEAAIVTQVNDNQNNGKTKGWIIESNKPIYLSDGYHSMDELYDHRMMLFVALLNQLTSLDVRSPFKSKLHADGTMYDGFFLAGLQDFDGKCWLSYHLKIDPYWELLHCNEIVTGVPEWDGHTSADVLERLKSL